MISNPQLIQKFYCSYKYPDLGATTSIQPNPIDTAVCTMKSIRYIPRSQVKNDFLWTKSFKQIPVSTELIFLNVELEVAKAFHI